MTTSITHLLNLSVTVMRPSQTADGQGGFSESLATVDTIKGRRSPASVGDRIVAGREEKQASHVFYFEGGVDVRERDILSAGSLTYEVVGLLPPSVPDHLKVQAKEFQYGTAA